MAPPWRSRSTASARCRTGSRRARSWRRAPRNGNIATFDLASGRADVDSLLVSIPILLSIGCIVGFLAGLLGVGGGMTLVPLLTLIFLRKQFPAEHDVHMAVATSLATILFTSLSSVRAHHVRGAVLWPVVWALVPGMLVGSLVGPQIVSHISSAAVGTVGFVIAGFRQGGLPPHTIGYVYWPALAAIVIASMLMAPLGARVAHSWPVQTLKRVFACMLYVLGAYMLWQAYSLWQASVG